MNKADSYALLYSSSTEETDALSPILEGLGIHVVPAANFTEAVSMAWHDCFTLILLDLDCEPDMRLAVKTFNEDAPSAAVVVYSRHPEERRWLDALDAGAFDYVCRPFAQQDLWWILENASRPRGDRPALKPVSAHVRDAATRVAN